LGGSIMVVFEVGRRHLELPETARQARSRRTRPRPPLEPRRQRNIMFRFRRSSGNCCSASTFTARSTFAPQQHSMKFVLPLLTFCLAGLGARGADRPNILFIAVDDLRPEFGAYGADYIKSPNLDRIAKAGITFN